MPARLNFVKGAEVSKDLSRNISRVTLQQNEIFQVNKKYLVKNHMRVTRREAR